jgi:peptide deformylase
MTNENDIGSITNKEIELTLVLPSDPRVQSAIAPFSDDMLKDTDFYDRQHLCDSMYKTMKKYGGVGLTCNQVGLPFNYFVIGGHLQIESGLTLHCFNPIIVSSSKEDVLMTEGCLTFPFVFLPLKRARKVVVKYEDEQGDLKEANLDGQMSRIFQHEFDHILGINFTEKASKLKLDRAFKKAGKQMERYKNRMAKNGNKRNSI